MTTINYKKIRDREVKAVRDRIKWVWRKGLGWTIRDMPKVATKIKYNKDTGEIKVS